jgi:hypothetical protein
MLSVIMLGVDFIYFHAEGHYISVDMPNVVMLRSVGRPGAIVIKMFTAVSYEFS